MEFFFFLRRGEGERVREQRRRRRRSKLSALSPLLSLLLQAFLFSYLWPPRQDRRDDPVLGKLDPRGLPDARALLRGRLADVEAEPFFLLLSGTIFRREERLVRRHFLLFKTRRARSPVHPA